MPGPLWTDGNLPLKSCRGADDPVASRVKDVLETGADGELGQRDVPRVLLAWKRGGPNARRRETV